MSPLDAPCAVGRELDKADCAANLAAGLGEGFSLFESDDAGDHFAVPVQ